MQQALIECRPLLRPGGHIVVTVRPRRQRGLLLDLTGHARDAARAAGLVPVDRCVALLAELRGDRLLVLASMAQRRPPRARHRSPGHAARPP
ncbi:hypothetical protein [Actinoallomurus sp. NPDC050550]|uniref:hypothetical protein n=1 Tax=Actinoallomurus sp. NPDC050550 TaxID=3154937 RepID=UPI0033F2D2A9